MLIPDHANIMHVLCGYCKFVSILLFQPTTFERPQFNLPVRITLKLPISAITWNKFKMNVHILCYQIILYLLKQINTLPKYTSSVRNVKRKTYFNNKFRPVKWDVFLI